MASRFRVVGALLAAVVVTAGAVGAGVVLRTPADEAPPAAEEPLATPLASVDTGAVVVRRASFCDAVAPEAAAAATSVDEPEPSTWSNGDQMRLASGAEVAHEYGCSWTAPGGRVASGWVFAPPVAPARARELVAAARTAAGCGPLTGATPYGAPSVALSCRSGARTTVSYRGLFGDAWLTCELTGGADVVPLADRWCAAVLAAAGAGRTAPAS